MPKHSTLSLLCGAICNLRELILFSYVGHDCEDSYCLAHYGTAIVTLSLSFEEQIRAQVPQRPPHSVVKSTYSPSLVPVSIYSPPQWRQRSLSNRYVFYETTLRAHSSEITDPNSEFLQEMVQVGSYFVTPCLLESMQIQSLTQSIPRN